MTTYETRPEPTTKLYIVTARTLGRSRKARQCGVRAFSESDARHRAAVKWYGKGAHWSRDSGLGPSWGQIVAASGSCITDRIEMSVDAPADIVRDRSIDNWTTV